MRIIIKTKEFYATFILVYSYHLQSRIDRQFSKMCCIREYDVFICCRLIAFRRNMRRIGFLVRLKLTMLSRLVTFGITNVTEIIIQNNKYNFVIFCLVLNLVPYIKANSVCSPLTGVQWSSCTNRIELSILLNVYKMFGKIFYLYLFN